jgi:hypothetical protein
MRMVRLALVAAAGLAVAGCAGGSGSSSGPMRPAVSVADEVSAIDRSLLIGRWACRELNPYPGRPPITATMELAADGGGHNSGVVDMAQQGGPMPGRMAMDFAYRWKVEGDRLVVSDMQSNIRAADENATSGMMAGIAQFAMRTFGNQAQPATSNVLKLDSQELVLRSADVAEAPVQSCSRA